MVNPFDKSFFKFVVGFTAILGLSFGFFFVIGKYSVVPTSQSAGSDKTVKIIDPVDEVKPDKLTKPDKPAKTTKPERPDKPF